VRYWQLDRGAVVSLVAALALGAAGCADERRDFRVEKLDPLVKRVSDQRAQLAATLHLVRPHRARDAQLLRAQVARLGATLRRVASLRPPAGTATRFHRYTRANTALLASLSRFVNAFAAGSVAAQRRAGQDAQTAVATANQAETDLRHALG
jgi:hypothetical protein